MVPLYNSAAMGHQLVLSGVQICPYFGGSKCIKSIRSKIGGKLFVHFIQVVCLLKCPLLEVYLLKNIQKEINTN